MDQAKSSREREMAQSSGRPSRIVAWLLLGATLSIITTSFAVPGQQKGWLINQGRTLTWLVSEDEVGTTVAGVPFTGPIHQLVRSHQDESLYYVATGGGLFAWRATDRHWQRLYPEEVFAVAESHAALLIGTAKGLWVSRDGGRTWQPRGQGLPPQAQPWAIEVAPNDGRVVYLSTVGRGMFRSDDGGEHFQAINRGLPAAIGPWPVTPVRHILIDRQDARTVYVSTEVHGIYKTTDGGEHWTAATPSGLGLFPRRTYQPLLAFHPTDEQTLYAVMGFPVHSHLIDNKIYKTTDGGAHWMAIAELPPNRLFASLTVVPADPLLLVLGSEEGVILIRDAGQRVDGGPYWKPSPPPLRSAKALNTDVGDIAVIEDDGTLVQNFDLHNRSIEFVPRAEGGYDILSIPRALEAEFGAPIPLDDDDSFQVSIPFPFQFYGAEVDSVFVNSNGHLTFGRGDPSTRPSAALSFLGFRQGPPKIAAFWENYDPSAQGSVHVRLADDPPRLIVTWNEVDLAGSAIPGSNTFQVVLLAGGRIRLNYGRTLTNPRGLVGLSPGNTPMSAVLVNFSRDLPQTIGNEPVLEFFTGRGLDIQAVARRFYETHEDLYDQLVVFGSGKFQSSLVGVSALAFNAAVQNDIQGIGRPVGNFLGGPAAFGSQGRLQSFLNMNRLGFYPNDPDEELGATFTPLDIIGHETAHRWLAFMTFTSSNGTPSFALLASDLTHWSFFFNSDASLMYGNRWMDNEDGTFTSVEATARYGALDEYAMGLRPPSDVKPTFFIAQPEDPEGRTRNTLPEVDVTVGGTRAGVTIDQIISQNGPRIPRFGRAPTRLTQAYILIIPEGTTPNPFEIEKLDRFRRAFEDYFNRISGYRAVVDTRLTPGQPDLRVDAASLSSAMLGPGDTTLVSFTIRNEGTAAAGLVVNEIRFFSQEGDASGTALLKSIPTMSLAPGESVTLQDVPVHLLDTVPSGTHFIEVDVDAGDAIQESDEENNRVMIPITIVGEGVRLRSVDEAEPNNRSSQAQLITPDALIEGTLDPPRDVDFYVLDARAGQTLTIDINARSLDPPSLANTLITLFDEDGVVLAENDDFAGSRDSFLQVVIPRAGSYVIRIANVPNSRGGPLYRYQAVVRLRSASSFEEVEPNDERESANPVVPDVIIEGRLDPTGDDDLFVFAAGAGELLTVDIDAQSLIDASAADTIVAVLDENGSLIAENDDAGSSKDSFLQVVLPREGSYFVRLRDVAGRGGPAFTYRATLRLTSVQTGKRR